MKSNKEIQADYKKRKRSEGYELKAVWAFKEDWPEIKKFIEGKTKKRVDKVTSNI
jgi:hypothetical protein